jgi:hypothetical protein
MRRICQCTCDRIEQLQLWSLEDLCQQKKSTQVYNLEDISFSDCLGTPLWHLTQSSRVVGIMMTITIVHHGATPDGNKTNEQTNQRNEQHIR